MTSTPAPPAPPAWVPGDEVEVNEMIALASSSVTLSADRVYDFRGPLELHEKGRFILDGNGAQGIWSHQDPEHHTHMMLWCRDSAPWITNFSIDGGKHESQPYEPKYEDRHGIGLYGCTDFKLSDLEIQHVAGDFIYMAHACKNGIIEGVDLWDAGRHALCAQAVAGLKIGTSVAPVNAGLWHRRKIDKEPMGAFRSRDIALHPSDTWDKHGTGGRPAWARA